MSGVGFYFLFLHGHIVNLKLETWNYKNTDHRGKSLNSVSRLPKVLLSILSIANQTNTPYGESHV